MRAKVTFRLVSSAATAAGRQTGVVVVDRGRSIVVQGRATAKGEGLETPTSLLQQNRRAQLRPQQQEGEEKWTVGAYVIMRGSVDLYVLERWAGSTCLPVCLPAVETYFAVHVCRRRPPSTSVYYSKYYFRVRYIPRIQRLRSPQTYDTYGAFIQQRADHRTPSR